jgi:NADPH:quinone reductase-like Zn-dependent oxidoreductase
MRAMKAVRVHRFGGPEVMLYEDIVRPIPAADELLVRIEAAGVGPWDAWIRAGHSALPQPLPLTLGSDIAGVIEAVGESVTGFHPGMEVYGVTNTQFTGGYAQYAAAKAAMVAKKPATSSFVEAAALPVVALTAWQMLFDCANIQPGQRVLILGASGSVGCIAVQLAHRHRAHTIAAVSSDDAERLRRLGADEVIDRRDPQAFAVAAVDAVIDAAGGIEQTRAISLLKRGGYLISCVSAPDPDLLKQCGAQGAFFLVKTTTPGLQQIAELIDRGALCLRVGTVLPMADAQLAHQMLDGIRPYARGKIVLKVTCGGGDHE